MLQTLKDLQEEPYYGHQSLIFIAYTSGTNVLFLVFENKI